MKEFCSKRQPARFNAIDSRFLERVIKTTWEGASKGVRGKMTKPMGTVFVDANIRPSDISKDLDGATFDKIGFNYTGEIGLLWIIICYGVIQWCTFSSERIFVQPFHYQNNHPMN